MNFPKMLNYFSPPIKFQLEFHTATVNVLTKWSRYVKIHIF